MGKFFKFIIACLCVVGSSVALADDEPLVRTDANGQKIWHLTSYLKGTTPQVVDLLNSEVIRLHRQREEARASISERQADITRQEKHDLDVVHLSAEYRKLVDELGQASIAHDNAQGMDRLNFSSKMNHLRASLAKLERDCTSADAGLKDDRAHLAQEQQELKNHEAALVRAYTWRGKLVDAIQNTFVFSWPLQRGNSGYIARIVPTVVEDGVVIAEMSIGEETGAGGEQGEGLVTSRYIMHPVMFLFPDMPGAKVGQPLALDATYTITANRFDADLGQVYAARRSPGAIDELLMAAKLPAEVAKDEPPPAVVPPDGKTPPAPAAKAPPKPIRPSRSSRRA